jgi:hypothetical protein
MLALKQSRSKSSCHFLQEFILAIVARRVAKHVSKNFETPFKEWNTFDSCFKINMRVAVAIECLGLLFGLLFTCFQIAFCYLCNCAIMFVLYVGNQWKVLYS